MLQSECMKDFLRLRETMFSSKLTLKRREEHAAATDRQPSTLMTEIIRRF